MAVITHIEMKLLGNIIILLATLAVLTGCTSEMPEPVPGEGAGTVNLVIRVGVNTSPGSRIGRDSKPTRAGEYPSGYPYDFEPAATIYEGINTLRVIIVDPNNIVEHNAVWSFDDHAPSGDELYGDMGFKVKGGEAKRVYLIANEASITPSPNLRSYAPGETLTPETASRWLIYKSWGDGAKVATPYIDNQGSAPKRYIPMSEFFELDIKKGKQDEVVTQSETLFLTRSLVKFSFYVSASPEIPESFRISNIEFDNVMEQGYLFPHETEYLPAKMPLTNDFQRIVTSFATPGFVGNKVLPISFAPIDFGLNSKAEATNYKDSYIPQLYFCETRNNNAGNIFRIKLTVLWGDGEETTYEEIKLPNLPSFPRNTHVKVYLTFADRAISGTVDLVPYVGIELKPSFGFSDFIIGEHRPSIETK